MSKNYILVGQDTKERHSCISLFLITHHIRHNIFTRKVSRYDQKILCRFNHQNSLIPQLKPKKWIHMKTKLLDILGFNITLNVYKQ
jgi:hypothetical protein